MNSYYVVWQDKERTKLEVLECPTFENLNEELHRINDEQGHTLCVVHGVKLEVLKKVSTSFVITPGTLKVSEA